MLREDPDARTGLIEPALDRLELGVPADDIRGHSSCYTQRSALEQASGALLLSSRARSRS